MTACSVRWETAADDGIHTAHHRCVAEWGHPAGHTCLCGAIDQPADSERGK